MRATMCRDRLLVLARVAASLLAVVVVLSATGCGRLDEDSVSTELKTLQSSTAEGMLVAEEAARSRAAADFIEIRTAELSKQSANAAKTLDETPTEAGLQRAAGRGSEIGNRASEILDELHGNPGDEGLARNVARELDSLRDEAGRIEASL
jgi:hypothetical protein